MKRAKKAKPKPKPKPKRVVLGVGYPWFTPGGLPYPRTYSQLLLYLKPGVWEQRGIDPGQLGNWNKIRLVAEVLK